MNKPEYKVMLSHSMWCVYKMEYYENGSSGSKISSHHDRDEAILEMYKLNGWKTDKLIINK